jgi:hypothetical protein
MTIDLESAAVAVAQLMWEQQRLDGAAFVHRSEALGGNVRSKTLPGSICPFQMRSTSWGRKQRRRGTAVQVDLGEEQLVVRELNVVEDPDEAV